MYKKILILCLSAGALFTSCQSESVSEEIQSENVTLAGEKTAGDLNSKWHYPDYLEGPGATYSEPTWSTGPTPTWHTPDWTIANALNACNGENNVYDGSANLTVNSSSDLLSYKSGETATQLKNLNIGGELAFCGYLEVENTVNVRRSGEFAFSGEMMIGSEEAPADLVINRGAHLHLSGTVYISGDLIINPFAEVNIHGDNEVVFVVAGEVYIDEKAEINDYRVE